MKNPQSKSNQPASNALTVTLTLEGFPFVRNLVEKLSYPSFEEGSRPAWMDWQDRSLQGSSIEAYLTGHFHLSHKTEKIRMSFTSSFFFTCVKEAGQDNRLLWCHSLS